MRQKCSKSQKFETKEHKDSKVEAKGHKDSKVRGISTQGFKSKKLEYKRIAKYKAK